MADKQRTGGKVIDLMAALKASLYPEQVCKACGHVHDGKSGACTALVDTGPLGYLLCHCPSIALHRGATE